MSASEYKYGAIRCWRAGSRLRGRHFGDRVDIAQIFGEAAHYAPPLPPPDRLGVHRLGCPGQRQFGADMVGAVTVQVADEVGQQPSGIDEFETQAATQGEVGGGGDGKVGHRAPGQGRASSRVSAGAIVAYDAVTAMV
jgi:hypothetical protein